MGSYLRRETLKIQIEYGKAIYMEDLMLPGLGTMEATETEGSGTTEGKSVSRSRQWPLYIARQGKRGKRPAPRPHYLVSRHHLTGQL